MADKSPPFDEEKLGQYMQKSQQSLYQRQDSEITKFLLEMESIIQHKLLHYQGKYFDKEQGKIVTIYKDDERMINDKGLEFANRQFRHYLHKSAALANLTAKQVSELVLDYSSRLRRHLLHQRINYGLKSIAAIDEIKNDIVELAFLNLTRSIDDKERGFINQARRVVETLTNGGNSPDRRGLRFGI